MTVRAIKKRGATIVVQANGELLFMPSGDVGRWKRRFSANAQKFAAMEAPTNKRPRWAHYGKPLKSTINRSSTRFVKTPGGARLYSAVGSTSRHAIYVDQGTGVYAGRSPWKAKILPPWTEGSPSLYEASWHPPGQNANHTVMIKGQRPQYFLDKGLRRTFRAMRMRQTLVPIGGLPGQMSQALNSTPSGLENFLGNTPADGAFVQQLQEWRSWRQEAFDRGDRLGARPSTGSNRRRSRVSATVAARRTTRRQDRAERSRLRSQERRNRIKAEKAKSREKPVKATPSLSRASDRQRVKALAIKRFGAANVDSITYQNGQWKVLARVFTDDGGGVKRPEYKVFSIKARS